MDSINDLRSTIHDLFQDEARGGKGSVIAAVAGEGVLHGAPAGGLVGEEAADAVGQCLGGFRKLAAADDCGELEMSLLLTGNEVMDEHRATGGDGFVGGGPASLADDEMMAVEEQRNPPRPADEPDAARVGFLDFAGAGIKQPHIPPEDDGEMHGG